MSYNTEMQNNNEELQAILNAVNNLPDRGSGTGEDGVGILSVAQTTKSTEDDGVNVITVTLTDGSKYTFEVENGSKGSKGDKGDTGAKGDKGDTGAQGIQGEKGETGATGDKGKDGTSVTVKSVSESTADGGSNTVTFSDGKTVTIKNGSKGSTGSKGDKGDKGDTGATGAKGDKGDTGAVGANGQPGNDGYSPVKGVDYWTAADQNAIKKDVNAYIADELAKRGQLKPEFAESLEWLKENGEQDKMYVLPDGMIYAWMLTEVEVEGGESYTNRLPLAINANGTPYVGNNGEKGYKTGYRLNSSRAEVQATSRCCTGFIPVKYNDTVRFKNIYNPTDNNLNGYIHFYGSNFTTDTGKAFEPKFTNGEITFVPSNVTSINSSNVNATSATAYMRISTGIISENSIITINEEIVEGGGTEIVEEYAWANTGHAFVPADYEDRIVDLENTSAQHTKDIVLLQQKVETIGTNVGADQVELIKNWNAPIYDDAPVFLLPTEKPAMGNTTVAAIYAKYDALMAQHPNYITKTDLGLASDGSTHIYRYDFCEPRARKNQGSTNHPDLVKPKAIIVSGIHIEYAGMYALYYALEEIANNAELYQDLRKNTHLIVVPAMNPYCLDSNNYSVSNGRKNANGVEIHRNFEVEHKVVDASSNNYGGAKPLSEVEAQYVDNIMKNNTDAAFFLTCHNFDYDTYSGTGFIWPSVATHYMYNMGDRLINKMSKAWLDKYGDTFRNGVDAVKTDSIADGDYTVGSVGMSGTPGTETKQALKYGIQGTNVEIAKLFKVLEPNVTTAGSAQVMSRGAEVYINFLRMAFGCYDPKDKKQYFIG